MMAYLKQEENKEFIFVTLIAPNVPADELEDEIKDYNHSVKKLMERKEVKKIAKGYARKLEITYNEECDDYHPHFHVLITVNKSYFPILIVMKMLEDILKINMAIVLIGDEKVYFYHLILDRQQYFDGFKKLKEDGIITDSCNSLKMKTAVQ